MNNNEFYSKIWLWRWNGHVSDSNQILKIYTLKIYRTAFWTFFDVRVKDCNYKWRCDKHISMCWLKFNTIRHIFSVWKVHLVSYLTIKPKISSIFRLKASLRWELRNPYLLLIALRMLRNIGKEKFDIKVKWGLLWYRIKL